MAYDIRTCSTHPFAAHQVVTDGTDTVIEVRCLKCGDAPPQGGTTGRRIDPQPTDVPDSAPTTLHRPE